MKAARRMSMVRPQVNLEIFNKTVMDHMHSEMTVEVKILTVSRAVAVAVAALQTMIRRKHVVRIARHADRRDRETQAVNDNQHVAVAAGEK